MKMHTTESKVVHSFACLRAGSKHWLMDASGFWSYPALLRNDDGSLTWLHLVLMAVPMPEKKRTALFRPKALVVTKANLPEVVRYENLRTGLDPFPTFDWDKPLAMFPHKSVATMTYDAFQKAEMELLAMYPDAGALFAKEQKLPKAFVDAYVSLVHPVFLPFVRQLTPDFFAALGVEKK